MEIRQKERMANFNKRSQFLPKLVWRLFQESVHKSSSNFEAYWSPARGDWLFLLFWFWNTTFSTLNYEWHNWRKLIPKPFGFAYLAWRKFECCNWACCDRGGEAFWGDFFYKVINPVISRVDCKKNYWKWCTHLREFPFIKCSSFANFVVSVNCLWPCLVTLCAMSFDSLWCF